MLAASHQSIISRPQSTIGIGKTDLLTQRFSCIAMTLLSNPWQERFYFECKIKREEGERPLVLIQPLGGAVEIGDLNALHQVAGSFNFDSLESQKHNDLRVYLSPDSVSPVSAYCRKKYTELATQDIVRELVEELQEMGGIFVQQKAFAVQSTTTRFHCDQSVGGYRAPKHGEASSRVFFLHHGIIVDPQVSESLNKISFSASGHDVRSFLTAVSNHPVLGDRLRHQKKANFFVTLSPEDLAHIIIHGAKGMRYRGFQLSEPLRWMLDKE
jgi:hypothetical protein